VPRAQSGQRLREVVALLLGPVDELLVVEHGENRQSRGGGERVAPEGRAVRAWRQRAGQLFATEHGPDGEPAAEPFGERNRVRHDAVLFAGEERPRAPDAGLYFVEQKEGAGRLGDTAQASEKAGRRRKHAALTLHRLHDDAGQIGAHRPLDGSQVSIGQMRDAAGVGAETFSIFGATRHGQRAEGATMECLFESDDAITILLPLQIEVVSTELEQRFVGFRAGTAEEGAAHPRAAAELRCQEDVGLVVEVIGHVNEASHLLGDGRHVTRMRMSERGHRHARCQIEVALAALVPDLAAVAAYEDTRRLAVVGIKVLRSQSEEGFLVRIRHAPDLARRRRHPNPPAPDLAGRIGPAVLLVHLHQRLWAKRASAISAKPAPRMAQDRYRGGTESRGRLAERLATPKLVVNAKKQGASLALSPMYA